MRNDAEECGLFAEHAKILPPSIGSTPHVSASKKTLKKIDNHFTKTLIFFNLD
jgi:hypothetical protein